MFRGVLARSHLSSNIGRRCCLSRKKEHTARFSSGQDHNDEDASDSTKKHNISRPVYPVFSPPSAESVPVKKPDLAALLESLRDSGGKDNASVNLNAMSLSTPAERFDFQSKTPAHCRVEVLLKHAEIGKVFAKASGKTGKIAKKTTQDIKTATTSGLLKHAEIEEVFANG